MNFKIQISKCLFRQLCSFSICHLFVICFLSFGIADQVFELSRVPLYASAEIPLENTEEFSVSSVFSFFYF